MLKVELADLVKQTKLVHYIKEESKIKKDPFRNQTTHPILEMEASPNKNPCKTQKNSNQVTNPDEQ